MQVPVGVVCVSNYQGKNKTNPNNYIHHILTSNNPDNPDDPDYQGKDKEASVSSYKKLLSPVKDSDGLTAMVTSLSLSLSLSLSMFIFNISIYIYIYI